MELDYKKKAEEISTWLKKTVQDAGFSHVVIALSGGIDSAVATTLAVQALGKEHVHVLLLPYGKLNTAGTQDAKKVTTFLKLPKGNVHEINIEQAVLILSQGVARVGGPHRVPGPSLRGKPSDEGDERQDPEGVKLKFRKGNIMARVRMIYLYDLAKKLPALVVGTENKSEYYLSYFTRFGDEASDIEPIRHLYKTHVFALARYLHIPKQIIDKSPTAGLWEGQTDEKEFGFSYADADRVLYHYFDEGLPEEGIIDLGIDRKIVRKVLEWVRKNDFKHHLPVIYE